MSRKVQDAPTHVWQVVLGSPSGGLHPPAGWTGFLKDSLIAAFQVIEAEAEVLLGSVPLNSQDASSATYYWSKQVTSSA